MVAISELNGANSTPKRGTDKENVMDRAARWALCILVFCGVAFLILPLFAVAVASFNIPPSLSAPPREWSLDSYRQISTLIYSSLVTSIELAVGATASALILGVPAAFGLVRGFNRRKRSIVENVLRSPLQIPQLLIGAALVFAYFRLISIAGINLSFTFSGLLLGHIILVEPYVIGVLIGEIEKLDVDIEHAGRGLGASDVRVFGVIALPSIRQAMISAGLLSFLVSFDNVPLSLFLSGPGATTLPVVMFQQTLITLSPTLYAASALVVLITVAVVVVLDRLVGLRKAIGR
jgi:putative spermidine/putrescine transport system permease protein